MDLFERLAEMKFCFNKILNAPPFWKGLGWVVLVMLGAFLRDHAGTSGKGPAIQYWPLWAWVLMASPGAFVMCASLSPDSKCGKIGKMIICLCQKIHRINKGK